MIGGAPTTRQGLLSTRRRIERVGRGIEILRRKREALVTEFFRRMRPALDARRELGDLATQAHRHLLDAHAAQPAATLDALGAPERPIEVEVEMERVWGVSVPARLERPALRRTVAARGIPPGSVGPGAVEAAASYEQLAERLLDLAPHELLLRGLGEALARTTRQLNTLEHRVAPRLAQGVRTIAGALEERERDEHLRLRHLRGRLRRGG